MTGTSIKSVLAFALLVGVASQANADIWGHIDRQANDIERATKRLRNEVDHYRHTRYFGQLIGATARLKGQAIHVHNIADHSQCPKALKIAVRELERAFHDAEDLFDRVEHNAAFGDGRIRGNTAHVKEMLNRIRDCIYNLQADLRQLTRATHTVGRRPYHAPVPRGFTPVGYDSFGSGFHRPAYGGGYNQFDRIPNRGGCNRPRGDSGFGISIGGGSSRITFRF